MKYMTKLQKVKEFEVDASNNRKEKNPIFSNNRARDFFPQKPLQKQHKKDVIRTKFLDTLQIPELPHDASLLYEGELTESESKLYDALKNMPNNKSPVNDGLTKEFFSLKSFWDDIKDTYVSSIWTVRIKKEFSVSQRQAIFKLIERN